MCSSPFICSIIFPITKTQGINLLLCGLDLFLGISVGFDVRSVYEYSFYIQISRFRYLINRCWNRVTEDPKLRPLLVNSTAYDWYQEMEEKRKRSSSLSQQILNKLIPDNLDFNHYTMLSRVSSLMIRQNSILMAQLMKPDVLVDIQMSRYGGFDYDKSEKIIAIGRKKTQQALDQYFLKQQ